MGGSRVIVSSTSLGWSVRQLSHARQMQLNKLTA